MNQDEPTFSFIKQEDVPEIVDLFKKSFGRTMSEAYYRWQFTETPLPGLRSIVARINGRIVSHVGYTPRACRLAGRNGLVFAKHTSMTAPEWRGRGIYSRLLSWAHRQLANFGGELVLSWPNANNHPIQIGRDDYYDIHEIPSLRRIPSSARERKDLVPVPFITIPDVLPSDYAPLCEQTSAQAPFCYIRSPRYFQWRYARRPDVTYFLIEERQAGRLRAAIIGKTYPSGKPNRIMVCEWLSVPDDPLAVGPLDELEDYARMAGMPVLLWHNIHDHKRHKLLERRGYTLAEPILYFGAFPLADEKRIAGFLEYENWYTTMGDVDVF